MTKVAETGNKCRERQYGGGETQGLPTAIPKPDQHYQRAKNDHEIELGHQP